MRGSERAERRRLSRMRFTGRPDLCFASPSEDDNLPHRTLGCAPERKRDRLAYSQADSRALAEVRMVPARPGNSGLYKVSSCCTLGPDFLHRARYFRPSIPVTTRKVRLNSNQQLLTIAGDVSPHSLRYSARHLGGHSISYSTRHKRHDPRNCCVHRLAHNPSVAGRLMAYLCPCWR